MGWMDSAGHFAMIPPLRTQLFFARFFGITLLVLFPLSFPAWYEGGFAIYNGRNLH